MNFRKKIIMGILTGLLGVLLMEFSIGIQKGTFIDLRHIAIVTAAFLGGTTASLTAAIIIGVVRLLYSEINNMIMAITMITILVGLLVGEIKRLKIPPFYQWLFMIILSTFLYSIVLYYRIRHLEHFALFLQEFWALSLIGGLFTFYLVHFLKLHNFLYYNYKLQATYDYRTGLKNARQFDLHLTEAFSNPNIKQDTIGLLFIDIDYFKQINDRYGHPAGDLILQEVAGLLKSSVRKQDKVYRNGGEEFSVLLLNTNLEEAIQIAERVRISVEKSTYILPDQTQLKVTISIGVVTNSRIEESPMDLVHQADEALYEAKRTGRNKVCWALTCQQSR
ncbi:diguanylate cyclase [Neobacillus cucumis]|nr:diguanylate cyclase [Neobacillus cucumis]MBM7652834.1 diguanylate cyclase [Neobacillus cucumis]